ncbi:MAG TPA: NAD(P)/FAD-dependent oxidoreductase [Micromonosporaceae bacterium]|nr:NAD(P)/FAD-dependent oxidoreductase [Micromonosporaceae bacterium]
MAKPRIVIVGAGFAGYHAAKTLSRLGRGQAEIVLLNPTDYFLYLPLLPEVATGILEPTRVAVPLAGTLDDVRVVVGEAQRVDLSSRRVSYIGLDNGAGKLGYDRLILAVGSVNKLLAVPGVSRHAHGFRGLPEAIYLHDHVVRQIELAEEAPTAEEQAARSTFVVVGAGYTGTEVAAHGQLFTEELAAQHPRLATPPKWLLLDLADRVLPELHERLSRTAKAVLDERGVEVLLGTSVKEARADGVLLSNGRFVPTRSLIWCVGVRPDPLVAELGLETRKGRLVVDEFLTVAGHPEVYACGDAAAVPDLTRPGQLTPMTAQHAQRQGKLAAYNVAASYGRGRRRAYRHQDLGFLVDLGGSDAAANPLHVPLSGLPAKTVTRGYHLAAMPGNRARVAADWLIDAALPRPAVQLGLVPANLVPLETSSPETVGARG